MVQKICGQEMLMTEKNSSIFINPQSGIIRLQKLRTDVVEDVFCDKDTPWMMGLLEELNEQVEEEDLSPTDYPTYIEFKGQISKIKNSQYEQVLVVKGELTVKYLTYCISTGELMSDILETEIIVGAIDQLNQAKYDYNEEIITIDVNGEELDLYYFEDQQVDLAAIFHEYIYLNKNPYPRLTKQ